MRSSPFDLLSLLLLLGLCSCGAPARRNPLFDRQLLPSVEFRGAVRRQAVLNLYPVLDQRSPDRGAMSAAEAALLPTASEVVHDYLLRELRAARLVSAVTAGRYLKSEFSLRIYLLVFEGEAGGGLRSGSGQAALEFRVRLERSIDGSALLDRSYVQQVTEQTAPGTEPDALALVCRALKAAAAELLVDLSRLDLTLER